MVKVADLELETFQDEGNISELPPTDIIAYNELRSCADLYRMYSSGVLEIQPGYQREIVWKDNDQTRFIDSLIKKLPIPSMVFSYDYKNEKYQVVDGLQRLWSIILFLNKKDWTLATLNDIDPLISGQPVEKFFHKPSDLYKFGERVENYSLPVTILRCDYSKKSHQQYIFMIFHRLNRLGSKLNNQEIRNCIYGGSFNNLLKELNSDKRWLEINKMKAPTGYRFVKEEIILRFFTFHDTYMKYDGHLADYLNNYMSDHMNAPPDFLAAKRKLFNDTIEIISEKIFEGKKLPKLSISILESLLVGISLNIDYLKKQTPTQTKAMYDKLLQKKQFSPKNLREGIAGKEKVIGRLKTAQTVFSGH